MFNRDKGTKVGKAAPKGTPPGRGIPVPKSQDPNRRVAKGKPRQR